MRRFGLGWLALLIPALALAKDAPGDLDRWVGNYATGRSPAGIRVTRDGDHLVANAPGQPPTTLVPDKKPGQFAMRGAPITIQFVIDASGRVTRFDMTGPDGRVFSYPRVPDNAATLSSLRATAVRAKTAVNAQVFNGYERTRDGDGHLRPETYALGEGGFMTTDITSNASLDGMSFDRLALLLAPALASQGYVRGSDVDHIQLLVMVYWGATASATNPQVVNAGPMRNVVQDQVDRQNATMLGYESVYVRSKSDPLIQFFFIRDSLDRLQEDRYWIALVALDFPLLHREKQVKPLWSIRYNISSQGLAFDRALPQMNQIAARFFGRSSGGLLEQADREGVVELGDPVILDDDVDDSNEPSDPESP